MAKDNRDRDNSDAASSSQSKRPALNHRDTSDSQFSDHAGGQHGPQQQQHYAPATRVKSHQKHVVGGGTGRLHGRVPSSKALHKNQNHHAIGPSNAKPSRRQSSPADYDLDRPAFPPTTTNASNSNSQRRSSSDLRLSSNSSGTSLRKNQSTLSLKRNRSHTDIVVKRGSKHSAAALKRSHSNPGNVIKKQVNKNQVHFDLGTDGQDDEDDDGDEWVDASSSASPYISRRGSVASVAQASAASRLDGPDKPEASVPGHQSPRHPNLPTHPRVASASSQHYHFPTSKLLHTLSSNQAEPKMSTDTATAQPASVSSSQNRQQQLRSESLPRPDSSASNLSAEAELAAAAQRRMMVGGSSSGGVDMTSRFVTTGSSGHPSSQGTLFAADPRISRHQDGDSPAPSRSRSTGAMSELRRDASLGKSNGSRPSEEGLSLTSDDEAGGVTNVSNRASASSSRTRVQSATNSSIGFTVPPAEKSRTQQKLNLQRASSTLEPGHIHHPGSVVTGPLVGGAGYDARDPRVGKLLERTGMEYLVVRRYQNPVARSITRLSLLSSANNSRRIPHANGQSKTNHTRNASDYISGAASRLSQSFKESDAPIQSASSAALNNLRQQQRPSGPKRAFSAVRANRNSSEIDTEDGGSRYGMNAGQRAGASLGGADGESTAALLRNLWEKNMDLSASQD
ncbi:hypothetical protein MCOR27_006789 [Pyricularia oryzae]|uniref:Uncharacterized protein n=5 Tax=Pyricularia TaxID=48558 RepID=A0ABQ8NRB1_PYRGI|nr:uncharacterized protein MGG_08893 [Pyricularia oryzae 70-15]ELQ42045.1 hypothetical protein OOU_Y34scaffold00240g52 [Pyricularia oryzae Y34]KAH8837164.1 hypothetical protein MCOR01_010802 [Pyricularia oryzae]KAI6300834.1 hypothetical protein MCOR33_003578 [Pyricularia grisea]EHA54115.1 hypothetical protein MGG_08893 [Pyricularia oryzae 70-15]KAH9438177.1 hypothetical protein MCOR02_001815 [Pyricularia oryzae]